MQPESLKDSEAMHSEEHSQSPLMADSPLHKLTELPRQDAIAAHESLSDRLYRALGKLLLDDFNNPPPEP